MSRTRFEELAKYIQLSFDKEDDKQILVFLETEQPVSELFSTRFLYYS